MHTRSNHTSTFVAATALAALLVGCNRNADVATPPPPATAVMPGGPAIDASSPSVTVGGAMPPAFTGIASGAAPSSGGTLSVIPGGSNSDAPGGTTAATPSTSPLPGTAASSPPTAGIPPDPAASPPAAGAIGSTQRPPAVTNDQPPSVSPGSKT